VTIISAPAGCPREALEEFRAAGQLQPQLASSLALSGQVTGWLLATCDWPGRMNGDGFPVMEATIDGELMRLRVAEFAAPAEPYLWRLRQEPTFLVTALREDSRRCVTPSSPTCWLAARWEACQGRSPRRLGYCPRRRMRTGPAWVGGCGWCGARRARGRPGCSGPPSAI